MDKLIFYMSLCSFLASLFFLTATWKGGPFLLIVIIKVVGLLGTILPVVYWLKLTEII